MIALRDVPVTADCIFCAIIAGEAPGHVVHEDEHTVAFLDINPITPGHTIVVPRRHADDLWDVEREEAARVMSATWQVARLVRERLGADGVNLFQATRPVAWQEVDHLHLHVLPRYSHDGLTPPPWDREWGADHGELAELAAALSGDS